MVLSDPREILTVADAILHDSTPVHVHFVMFVPALMGHANEEQQAKWLSDALTMKIVGSYAQTELGHGTFIRGLETQATYDPEREEFVLHTPNLSSIKWWPGSLGKTANHAIVLAQLHTRESATAFTHSWCRSEAWRTILPFRVSQWAKSDRRWE
uniref:Acyl-coenzyme A oxidase N-terminal domain-containing protein n=1 Tax=Rhipicephalus microplus TaxID=6941 RepID=A0A6G4ZXM6_RHIMP